MHSELQNEDGKAMDHLLKDYNITLQKHRELKKKGVKQVPAHTMHRKWYMSNQKKNTKKMVLLLLKQGANVNAKDIFYNTPLHLSVFNANVKIVKTLLKHNANVNARNIFRETPLHAARNLYLLRIIIIFLIHYSSTLCLY